MNFQIETKNEKNIWVKCEHKTILDILKDGWALVDVTIKEKNLIMVRNGYVNEFRVVEIKEVEE